MIKIRTPLDLGLIIRDQRRKSGLTQTELARKARVGRQWLIAVEQGKPGAAMGLVLRTLTALNLTLSINETKEQVTITDDLTPTDIDAVIQAARKPRP